MKLSDEILTPVLDIIGNTEAIAVNQASVTVCAVFGVPPD